MKAQTQPLRTWFKAALKPYLWAAAKPHYRVRAQTSITANTLRDHCLTSESCQLDTAVDIHTNRRRSATSWTTTQK